MNFVGLECIYKRRRKRNVYAEKNGKRMGNRIVATLPQLQQRTLEAYLWVFGRKNGLEFMGLVSILERENMPSENPREVG